MHKIFYFDAGKYNLSEQNQVLLCANPISLIAILLQEWKKKKRKSGIGILLYELIIRNYYFIKPNWQLLGVA